MPRKPKIIKTIFKLWFKVLVFLLKGVLHEGKKVDILIEGNRFKKYLKIEKMKKLKKIFCEEKDIFQALYYCHINIPMTLLNRFIDEKELIQRLREDIWPSETKMKLYDINASPKIAILEMIIGGIVFYNDIYQFPEINLLLVLMKMVLEELWQDIKEMQYILLKY